MEVKRKIYLLILIILLVSCEQSIQKSNSSLRYLYEKLSNAIVNNFENNNQKDIRSELKKLEYLNNELISLNGGFKKVENSDSTLSLVFKSNDELAFENIEIEYVEEILLEVIVAINSKVNLGEFIAEYDIDIGRRKIGFIQQNKFDFTVNEFTTEIFCLELMLLEKLQ